MGLWGEELLLWFPWKEERRQGGIILVDFGCP
jgi:hypothetical protein